MSRVSATPGRPLAGPSRTGPATATLPTYQPLQHPLNDKAQQSLRNLPRNHKLDPLKQRLQTANQRLTQAATDINDRLQNKIAVQERMKARREAKGMADGDDELDRAVDTMRHDTDAMTQNLELRVRQIIDSGEEVIRIERALGELDSNVLSARGRQHPSTQSTMNVTQPRQTRRRQAEGNASESDENVVVDQDEDVDMTENEPPVGAFDVLKQKVDQDRDMYMKQSMTERYATHNDYVNFRKMVHDAHYPSEDAPPLSHASTWFSDGNDAGNGTPGASSQNSRFHGTQGQEDDDDDLAVATERISIKCPLTLVEMKDPVSSSKCPHSFEKEAILDMINRSNERIGGGRSGQKVMACPVAGCDAMITAVDLHSNPVLIRKIARIQALNDRRARNDAGEHGGDSEDDDDSRITPYPRRRGQNAEMVSSSPAPMTASRIKGEAMSQAARRAASRGVSMVPATQVGRSLDDEEESE